MQRCKSAGGPQGRRLLAGLTIATCLVAAGCTDRATLEVAVAPDSVQLAQTACPGDGSANPAGSAPCGVDRMRLCAQRLLPEPELVCSEDVDLTAGTPRATLTLPPGEQVTVTVQAFNAAAAQASVWCGRTVLPRVLGKSEVRLEIFLSACGDFTRTRANPSDLGARAFHTATAIPGNLVLIAGGVESLGVPGSCGSGCRLTGRALQTAVVYDGDRGEVVRRFKLKRPRAFHSATVLPGGRVLLAGGAVAAEIRHAGDPLVWPAELGDAGELAEVVDPVTGTTELVGIEGESPQTIPGGRRALHGAVALDKQVLLAGGVVADEAGELSRPSSVARFDGALDPTTALGLFSGELDRARIGALTLPVGDPVSQVLLWGGQAPGDGEGADLSRYDRASEAFTSAARAAGSDGSFDRSFGAGASLGATGAVATGGLPIGGGAPSAEAFTATLQGAELLVRRAVGSMSVGRAFHAAARLPDGQVLIAGGATALDDTEMVATQTAELFDPGTGSFGPVAAGAVGLGALSSGRAGLRAAVLEDGTVLLSGGVPSATESGGAQASGATEVYNPAPKRTCAAADLGDPACAAFFGPAVDVVGTGLAVAP